MGLNKEAIKLVLPMSLLSAQDFQQDKKVMQFFTPFGLWSYIGVIISGFILGFIDK